MDDVSKARGISADIQSPRTKLLYFIYSAANNRIKAEPGVKSGISAALGYKSDGHFHYDWNYLVGAGMIEESHGYFVVTEDRKERVCPSFDSFQKQLHDDSYWNIGNCFHFFA